VSERLILQYPFDAITDGKKTKGVFFDLYGTLLILGNMKQAWTDWLEVIYAALCPHDASLTKEAFADCCHQFFGKEQPEPNDTGLTVFERRSQRLATSLDLSIEVAVLKDVATRATNAWQTHVRTDPAALEVLAALSETKTLALISNFDHPPHAYRVLREAGFDRYFKTIVVSGEVGVKKPNPEIFRMALEATHLGPEEVLYVGDTQEDVDGATAAGIRPILIVRAEDPWHSRRLDYSNKENHAPGQTGLPSAMTISSLSDILEIVEQTTG
jgi:HAD superfamily hydrolase (TIGR01549 family)